MRTLSVSEAAKELEVHPDTVRRYSRRGLIRTFRDFRGWRLFRAEDVKRLKEQLSSLKAENQSATTSDKSEE